MAAMATNVTGPSVKRGVSPGISHLPLLLGPGIEKRLLTVSLGVLVGESVTALSCHLDEPCGLLENVPKHLGHVDCLPTVIAQVNHRWLRQLKNWLCQHDQRRRNALVDPLSSLTGELLLCQLQLQLLDA